MGAGSVRVGGGNRRSNNMNKVGVKGLVSGKGKARAADEDVEMNHEDKRLQCLPSPDLPDTHPNQKIS